VSDDEISVLRANIPTGALYTKGRQRNGSIKISDLLEEGKLKWQEK